MKKGSINITIKALYVVFLLIFVLFFVMTSLRSTTKSEEQTQRFEKYELASQLFLSFLSSPSCLTYGDYSNISNQVPIQGLLDFDKINKLHAKNADLRCIDSFDFLFSVQIHDVKNKRSWNVGIDNKDYEWAESKHTVSFPVAIMYDTSQVNLGEAVMSIYTGDLPEFYGTLKKVCTSRINDSIAINAKYPVAYEDNQMCFGGDCFTPSISCRLDPFSFQGEKILAIQYKGNDEIVVK